MFLSLRPVRFSIRASHPFRPLSMVAGWLCCASLLLVAGCATVPPRGMQETRQFLERSRQNGDERLLPERFKALQAMYAEGELLLRQGDADEAEQVFLLGREETVVLSRDLQQERIRRIMEEQVRRAAEQREQERLAEEQRQAAEKERLEKERLEKEQAEREREQERERQLPASHTVRRGETLPQIAARAEIYGDAQLWPLLYRANRDQIKDPRSIAAGQVLRVPRNLNREELAEARRYAQERPL